MKIENKVIPDILQKTGGAEKREEKEPVRVGGQRAFSIDSTARKSGIFKEAVYSKPKQDAEEIMEEISNQAQAKDAATMKNEMLFASDTTSSKDAEKLEEDGFDLFDTKIETVVTETDKIKMQLAKAGVDISIFGDALTDEQLKELAGSEALAIQMAREIAAADLPVTQDNLEESLEGMEMAGELSALTDGAVKYMLDNGLEPTIENLYKAEFSGSGSYQKPTEAVSLDGLQQQITAVIEEAGLAVSGESLADSRWLIENEIPLTPENLIYMQGLKGLQLPPEEQAVMDGMAKAMAEGKRPKDGMLMEGYTLTEKAEAAAAVLEQADDASLSWLIENDMELTIENLRRAEAAAGAGGTGAVSAEKELALLTARRQLEEARLAMSAQANYSLLKQGISIDTKPLAELVDALREQENSYYQQMLAQEGILATAENTALYRQTTETVEALKEVPVYTLGIPEVDEADLESLYEAGKAMQDSFQKAGESYETMMTAPRRDMGDSIQKAFANVDDILMDLGLETTQANERAVRILAYNRLEITEESVLQMKAKDEAVQRCFGNMTPSVVREMIREGINPLDMSIDELNQKAVEIKVDLGVEEEERFSKYLWKLDQNGAMTEEERSAFLGIYRLITQVEKTDGAAIGALMEQGSQFTMRNLLTQVRSGKHGQMEYTVDDGFGGVSSAPKGLSITEQIEKGYQTDCIRDILDHLTPETLGQLMEDENWQELTPEQLAERLAEESSREETAKADAQLEQAYIKEKVAVLETCQKASEEVYQMLLDCGMPSTVQNVIAAYEMLENRNEAFRKFFQANPEDTGNLKEEFAEVKQQILERFAEAVKTPEEMAEAQKALADTAENVMKTMINESDDVTSLDIRQMKLLNTQIAIGTAMVKEEKYAIPVLVGDEITNVSLKIVRGKEKKGMVDIVFSTERLGQVAASFSSGKDGVSGYVAAERKETTRLLEQNAGVLAENLSQEKTADIRYLTTEKLNLSALGREIAEGQPEEGTEAYRVQTKTLYHMAESFIRLVKGLE